MNKDAIIRLTTVLFVAVFLFLGVLLGVGRGRRQAQAELTARNTLAVSQGLDFFYADQSRFPTGTEFASAQVMQAYFDSFPPRMEATDTCPENFVYRRPSAASYNLSVCLETAAGGFEAGWNSLQVTKP